MLRQKIALARKVDGSWHGADPHPWSQRLDERYRPQPPQVPATLIAVDGSQVYPNRHSIAPYYLINVGGIILRQGSGQAPEVNTLPTIYYEDSDLYDDSGHLQAPEYVNTVRTQHELDALIDLAEAERRALGGDLTRPILALTDGPLLPWQPPQRRTSDGATNSDNLLNRFVERLDRLCALHVIPVGYVDRPASANLLRTLELIDLPQERIDRGTLRHGRYRLLADRLLLAGLEPNERTGLFASTSELNERLSRFGLGGQGYQVVFFYLNVARPASGDQRPPVAIGRVELPSWDWVIGDPVMLDLVQQALYTECQLTRYPYVLAHAHELAVVDTFERTRLEAMLEQEMWHCGIAPSISNKQANKGWTGGKRRN